MAGRKRGLTFQFSPDGLTQFHQFLPQIKEAEFRRARQRMRFFPNAAEKTSEYRGVAVRRVVLRASKILIYYIVMEDCAIVVSVWPGRAEKRPWEDVG